MEQALLSKYWHPALMVLLQFMDAATTLFLVGNGASEVNPMMDAALQHSTLTFCFVKFLAALLCVWIWTKNKLGAWIVTIPYVLVVIWNLSLVAYLLLG